MAAFANDTFTESDGVSYVALSSHTSDSGHSWSLTGTDAANVEIDTANDDLITTNSASDYVTALISATPPSADYSAEMDITLNDTTNFTATGPIIRALSDQSGYAMQVDPNEGTAELVRWDSGGFNRLGSVTISVASLPVTYNLKVSAEGSTIRGFIDGVEEISVTDATYSSAGSAGFIIRTQNSLPSNVNYRVDNFRAETLSVGPTITDVNTDESVYPGESFVITGTNFGATQGTGTVDIDGVAQTVTAWGDTSITCTAVRGGNEYGTGKTLTVTTDAATTATITVAQEAEPNTFAVTAASPNTTDDASLWTGLVDTATSNPITIVNGDQAWVKNPNNLTNLAISPSGSYSADQEGTFVVQIWLASEGVWGSDQTVTFEVPSAPGLAIARNKRVQLIIGVGL